MLHSRPDLGPRVGDHGEAGHVIVEPHPGNLLQRVERRRQLWEEVVSRASLPRSGTRHELEKVRMFLSSVLNRILLCQAPGAPAPGATTLEIPMLDRGNRTRREQLNAVEEVGEGI